MKRNILIASILIVILFFTSAAVIKIFGNTRKTVCFPEKCFLVELADNQKDRAIGLSFREKLGKDYGMFFIFEKEGEYLFWMKDTLIPLDIIWMDKNGEIIFIENNVQPCRKEPCQSFGPEENSMYVLEINGGLAEELGLTAGERAQFEL